MIDSGAEVADIVRNGPGAVAEEGRPELHLDESGARSKGLRKDRKPGHGEKALGGPVHKENELADLALGAGYKVHQAVVFVVALKGTLHQGEKWDRMFEAVVLSEMTTVLAFDGARPRAVFRSSFRGTSTRL
jgi:hypothetical protein